MIRSWQGALGLGLLSISCISCATVTIKPGGGAKLAGRPAYQDSKPYFFWGLMGEHEIDVGEICQGKAAEQMQSQYTFLDGFLGAITLGIYAPKTAKVWCK